MATEKTLAEQSGKILEAIQRHEGRWVSRKIIASELGKKTLGAADLVLLRYLEEQGRIKSASVPTKAPSGVRSEYKAVK
jgi:hypothetical protein